MTDEKTRELDDPPQMFDSTFKYLLHSASRPALVRFINGIFGKDYPPDSAVAFHATESETKRDKNNDIEKIMSDWTEENPIVRTPENTAAKMVTVTVRYDGGIKPYVISLANFKANANYYHQEAEIYAKSWINETDHSTLSEQTAHKYAVPTATPDEGISDRATGTITVTYELANGKTTTNQISVTFEKRLCEAYSKGRWRLVTSATEPDYWELK